MLLEDVYCVQEGEGQEEGQGDVLLEDAEGQGEGVEDLADIH